MSDEFPLFIADPTTDTAPNADAAPQLFYKIELSKHEEFRVSQLAIKQLETLIRLIEAMGYTDEDVVKKPPIHSKTSQETS